MDGRGGRARGGGEAASRPGRRRSPPTDLAGYKSNIAVETPAETSRFTEALSLIESNFKTEPLNRLTHILTPNVTTGANTYFEGRAAC